MRLLARNLQKLQLFKPTEQRDSGGDIYNSYDSPPVAEFHGNMQPKSESVNPMAYGLEFQYDYVVYVESDCGFCELDRIGADSPSYEIKAIQRWHSYLRLLVKEVSGHE